METRKALGAVLALLVAAGAAGAATYTVDANHPDAGDSNSGTAERPFKTISGSLGALRPGDTAVIRGGVYREALALRVKGAAGKPVTLTAAPGQRVIITGADRITGWKKCTRETAGGNPQFEKIYYSDIDWSPPALFQNRRPLPMSRLPKEGWWPAEGGGTHTLVDAVNLTQQADYWKGTIARFWDMDMTVQNLRPVTAFDAEKHELTFSAPIWQDRTVDAGKDVYYLMNKPQLIDGPGQWCVDSVSTPARVFLRPRGDEAPERSLIEGTHRGRGVVAVQQSEHVVLSGLEVTGGLESGIALSGAKDVIIERCITRHNQYAGLYVRDCEGITVRHCISRDNEYGLISYTVAHCTFEENEIGPNGTDGLHVTWGSDDVSVRRNYIHDHNLWGHCDNIQVFRGVTHLRIEDNALVNGLQNIMASETCKGRIAGNLILGSRAMQINLGGKAGEPLDYEIAGNTFALGGWGLLGTSGDGLRLHRNIFYFGQKGWAVQLSKPSDVQADHNVYCHLPGHSGSIVAWGQSWPQSFEAYQKASGQESHSLYADPGFRSAPVCFSKIDWRRAADHTRNKVYLWGDATSFAPGDHVEINFDGVVRTVKEAGADCVVFEPAFDRLPDMLAVIANWKDRTEFVCDLGLKADSPAAKAGPDGGPVGSRVDLAAYRRGDFDGDGKRDLPDLPAD